MDNTDHPLGVGRILIQRAATFFMAQIVKVF